jgi:hypothetical protein
MGKVLQAELFSNSISRQLEDRDLDLLDYQLQDASAVRLFLTNEALETHYINKFSLLAVTHPAGTRVFPSEYDGFVLFDNISPPSIAVDREGKDVFELIKAADTLSYRTELKQFPDLAKRGEPDWIEAGVNIPEGTHKVKLLVRLRNTLLSTILFYDVVLASQGIDALNWYNRMNNDQDYAARFRQVYQAFSGVSISVLQQGRWVNHSTIRDVGPITWKYVATEFPVERSGEFRVRLSSFPDNVALDYIGFSFDDKDSDSIHVEQILPVQALDGSGAERDDIIRQISNDDNDYLVTNPGDLYEIRFPVQTEENSETTLFISSKGYYTEWIRGSWLRVPNGTYRFDLSNTQATLFQLARSWLQNKDEIEQKFFQTRIPIRTQQ